MFSFFRRKLKNPNNKDGGEMSTKSNDSTAVAIVNEKPLICVFDAAHQDVESLAKASFNCTTGSLGSLMDVPNTERGSQKLLQPNISIPENLHEYDILVIDLAPKSPVPYEKGAHLNLKRVSGNKTYAFLSEYPQRIFDFNPFGVESVSDTVRDILKKGGIVVVFADEHRQVHYQLVEISSHGSEVCDRFTRSNMSLYSDSPGVINKTGSRIKKTDKGLAMTELILKYMKGGEYKAVFQHPTEWESSARKQVPIKNFLPLALNDSDQVVSFAHDIGAGLVLMFPQIPNKGEFLCELFNAHLAEHFPEIFPYSGEFGWLDDGSYPLPGELDLLEKRQAIESRYIKEVRENKEAVASLKVEYKFLRQLLSESGAQLVAAIASYLSWLGFDSVVNMDDSDNDTLEEDLQVDLGDRLLVIEVKGIGGTSTDKACSQISKIKFRRAEQRGRFDVFGLYIVNHQRYVSPSKRKNPPFTEHQINDARLDKRGLLTTFNLYRAFFLIEGGILSKEFVRERLFDSGVIDFYPTNMISLGQPKELLRKGRVLVIELDGVSIRVGMKLIAKKGDTYSTHVIESLQRDGVNVESASCCEIGIMVDLCVPNRSEILLWQEDTPTQV